MPNTFDETRFRGAVLLDQIAAKPATPAAGQTRLYTKDDGQLYTVDDDGIEHHISNVGDDDRALALNKLLTWAWDVVVTPTQSAASQGTGRLALHKMPWPYARTVSNLWTQVLTAGATLTSGQNLAGLYDSAGNLITGTTTATQHTAWASVGTKQMAITPVSVPATDLGWIWMGLLTVGSTIPLFQSFGTTAAKANIGLAATDGYRHARAANTGLTALPASVTLSTMETREPVWCALS